MSSRGRVFLLDDDELIVSMLARALTREGYEVQAEMVASWDPDFPERRACAFGADRPVFWVIETREDVTPRHVAFTAADRDAVASFHRAALGAGGRDHGAPGLRPDYHPNYYGAFILDPDGHNIEAVCHRAED